MKRSKRSYVCQECGHTSYRWYGRCPACGNWNTLVEEIVPEKPRRVGDALQAQNSAKLQPITEILAGEVERLDTGSTELNRVLGGGIVPGSVVLVGGDPGIGKSTLLLQVAYHLAESGLKVVYVSGEESPSQVRIRAHRLGAMHPNLLVLASTDIEQVVEQLERERPGLAIVDSIQTMTSSQLQSTSGSVGQVRECTGQLIQLAKTENIPILLVGHVTKGGALAGPKVLEHAVDAVLYFEGERSANYRILRSVKNRFGSTNEIGVFDMGPEGLREVKNPSQLFLSERLEQVSGSVVVASIEGTRPLLVEVQALVSGTAFGGTPRRQATGVDYNRVVMILAVLEKRMGYPLQTQDVFVNVAGGVRVTEPAIDLSIALAVASSLQNVPIDPSLVAMGEVGLGGEIRAVPYVEKRLTEAVKLGFRRCMLPRNSLRGLQLERDLARLEVLPVSRIDDALRAARLL